MRYSQDNEKYREDKMRDVFFGKKEKGASSRSPTFAVIIAVIAPPRGYAIV